MHRRASAERPSTSGCVVSLPAAAGRGKPGAPTRVPGPRGAAGEAHNSCGSSEQGPDVPEPYLSPALRDHGGIAERRLRQLPTRRLRRGPVSARIGRKAATSEREVARLLLRGELLEVEPQFAELPDEFGDCGLLLEFDCLRMAARAQLLADEPCRLDLRHLVADGQDVQPGVRRNRLHEQVAECRLLPHVGVARKRRLKQVACGDTADLGEQRIQAWEVAAS
mmetsp:Transcript_13377/g.38516  ORF Transcript_13377/g.38516 Transcript_13377/m.38516 type:complete len:223 (-) Transcript_13377:443-1111(-)